MHEDNIILKTKDGNLDCRIFISGIKKNPCVIFYMDAPAIREELRVMSRKIAGEGFNVILPNLFYRHGTEDNYPFDQRNYKKSKIELDKMLKVMHETSNAMIKSDTKFILDYIKKSFSNPNVGVIGYCMSGRFVIDCASSYPDTIKATASFYGVDIITNEIDSSHLNADKIKGDIYLAFAEKDHWVPNIILEKIKEHFSKISANTEIEVYEGTDHGFAFPSRNTYVKEAAERHWKKLFSFFNRTIK
tara:strand:+ start:333 stop:1070 length:738 start_codon:yes stop_codon:yes gene_type:complete